MRSLFGRTIVLGTCAVSALLWSGCEGKKATEYVTGISTQVKVPRDIKAVRIEVRVGGVSQFCRAYKVYDNKVQLPRSLGSFPNTQSALTSGPVTYTVVGVADADLNADFFTTCAAVSIGDGKARVLRRSTQPYIPDEIRFIPMPLKYSCFDKQCGEEETCKAGRCVSANLDIDQAKATFPPYDPGLVDGESGGCFDAKSCMGAAAPAVAVDPDTCLYAVANTSSTPATFGGLPSPFPPLPANTPWEGTNVEVAYDGGANREILDLDPEEGFFIPDPAKPQQFKLAPGLCEMVKGYVNPSGKDPGATCADKAECKSDACVTDAKSPDKKVCGPLVAHRITAVRASGTCQPKRLAQPFCAADQLAQMGVDSNGKAPPDQGECTSFELEPPRSALMVIADDTQGHANFFDAEQLKSLEFPLKNPAFERTDIGLVYAPAGGGCATNAPPTVPLEAAFDARQKLIDSFAAFAANPAGLVAGAPQYEGALASSYALLTANDAYYKRAVIVLGNRDFNVESCDGITGKPADLAAAAFAAADPKKKVSTYVLQLAKTDANKALADDLLDPGIGELFTAGSQEAKDGAYSPDARGQKTNAKQSFQQIVNSLATCVYDVPAQAAPAAEDIVSYSDPVSGTTTRIDANAACASEGAPGAGWGYGDSPDASKKRMFLCKESCTAYQSVLSQASDFALIYGQPAPAVPVFAHKKACDVK